MMQPQMWTTGNVVVDVEVNVFYDCVENEDAIELILSRTSIGADDGSNVNTSASIGSSESLNAEEPASPKRKRLLSPLSPTRAIKNVARKVTPKFLARSAPKPKTLQQKEIDLPSLQQHEMSPPPLLELSEESCREISIPEGVSLDPAPPLQSKETPLRFLRFAKNDPVEAQRRFEKTLAWRKEFGMDTIIKEAHPHFATIKENYIQYYHLRGRNNEPVWYEKPPKVNMQGLRDAKIGQDELIRYYAMLTEFGWQYLETDDLQQSITVIDMEGIRMSDFVGEVVDISRKLSAAICDHYPERAGYVFIVNVPYWFNAIWKIAKHFVDEATLEKIKILRGQKETREALEERIPIENIPPEYGGTSVPLGESPEENVLEEFMKHNNQLDKGAATCGGVSGGCRFCSWEPGRNY